MIVAIQDSLNGKSVSCRMYAKKSGLLVAKEQEKKKSSTRRKRNRFSLLVTSARRERNCAPLREKQRKEQQLWPASNRSSGRRSEAGSGSGEKNVRRRALPPVRATTSPVRRKNITHLPCSPIRRKLAKLSSDFENNRGRLPWPVEQGVITSSFGRHPHPVWRDVVVNNNGVDIGSARARARSVFEGKVLRVIMVVDSTPCSCSMASTYLEYSNLSEVFVKAG